jgi:hypothetical protein
MKALGKTSLLSLNRPQREFFEADQIVGRLEYSEPRKFSVVQKPLPLVRDDDVLVCKRDYNDRKGSFFFKREI